ncbi:MAG: ComF family protein [Bacteroidetes bacterium]|nr:ComF family protein [Bacteroidota bacterium]
MIQHLTNLLVDNTCYGCNGHLTIQEKHICLGCLSQMEETHFHQNFTENELFYRLAGRVPLAGAAGLFFFSKGGRLQSIIRHLKYKGAPALGIFLGRYYGQILRETGLGEKTDAIIPVPLHRQRFIQRGYNQAEKIALGLGKELDLPIITSQLKRRRQTLTQTRKGSLSRWGNVDGAFRTKGQFPPRILLVDDIITTGSTLEACIRALMEAELPPREIYILSIGVAKRD